MAESPESKMRSADRVLELEPMEGMNSGILDTGLFTGGNKLHAKMDPSTTLWYFQYEHGVLPIPLRDKFTSFSILKKYAENYFRRKNIKIKEIKD